MGTILVVSLIVSSLLLSLGLGALLIVGFLNLVTRFLAK
jgi:predicted membrane-bound spermidine synthase